MSDFGGMAVPDIEGLVYRPGHIDAAREAQLLALIDANEWSSELKRRVQHFCYRYDYKARHLGPDAVLGPLPAWLSTEAERLVAAGFFAAPPDQVIVNEYQPGQGIAPHIDRPDCFGDTVAGISLGAACLMQFSHPGSGRRLDLRLAPGSLFVLTGAARYQWRHGIAARKSDLVDGCRVPRGRRVSITFRAVRPSPLAAG
jgi:alkylated DNA repair dioxygenase AlkB